MNPSQENPSNITSISCPNCGSNEVGYDINKQNLLCNHCKHVWHLPRDQDEVTERALSEGMSLQDLPRGLGMETHVIHCNQCGSNTAIENEQVNFTCPFCGSNKVNEQALDTNVIRPSGILPFTYPRKKAEEQFRKWIKKGWFRPSKLSQARANKLQGVYLPFWTFDAMTRSSWKADAGHYYYETKMQNGPGGNPQPQQVRKVRWTRTNGYYEHFFDDVTIVASHTCSQKEVQKIFPFKLTEIVNYDSRYLLGWECEIYQKDVRDGMKDADKIMDGYIKSKCAAKVPGDTYRNLSVNTEKSRMTFKHIMLPVWVSGYMYNNKIFHFLINGETGKIHGKKPTSVWKVAFAILAAAALIVAIVFAVKKFG